MSNQAQPATDMWHGTTVLAVRVGNEVVIAADGQVTLGNTVIKHTASKVRKLAAGRVLVGFAGATADAMTLFERLEAKLERFPHQLTRACVELAKDWRTDRALRRLEALLLVSDSTTTLIVSGNGDVLAPDDDVAAIGSGGSYALAAALALLNSGKNAVEVARAAMSIAAKICIYTNENITMQTLNGAETEDETENETENDKVDQ